MRNKRAGFPFLIVFLIAVFACGAASAAIPKVREQTSESGIKFWHVEDNYLPIVSLKIIFTKSGAAFDPVHKQGLANMTASLLTEGAGGIAGVEFIRQLESMATSLSFNVDEDHFYVSMTCLKENLDESLRLLSLALASPEFSADATNRIREAILHNMLRKEENPEARAAKIFRETYFAGHPYARQVDGSAEGVKAINKKDLKGFVSAHLVRKNMVIGVVGNVTGAEIASRLDKYLGALPAAGAEVADIPEFLSSQNAGKVVRIEQDVPQSVILFGFAGPKRSDKDFYNTYLLNYILGGGGFESRLMHEVREKKGLAYNVTTTMQLNEKSGLIAGYAATKNSSVDETLAIIREEISKINKSGIKKEELKDSQDYLLGSFPLKITKNADLAAFVTSMWRDGLGLDFLERRNGYIMETSVSGVNAAAVKYTDPAKMLVVIVGKAK
jgi:zinc protease